MLLLLLLLLLLLTTTEVVVDRSRLKSPASTTVGREVLLKAVELWLWRRDEGGLLLHEAGGVAVHDVLLLRAVVLLGSDDVDMPPPRGPSCRCCLGPRLLLLRMLLLSLELAWLLLLLLLEDHISRVEDAVASHVANFSALHALPVKTRKALARESGVSNLTAAAAAVNLPLSRPQGGRCRPPG